MAFEREFVEAGGLLAAGVDPTGLGGALAGYGDQRNYELFIEAGFTPAQAIQIMTPERRQDPGRGGAARHRRAGQAAPTWWCSRATSPPTRRDPKAPTVFQGRRRLRLGEADRVGQGAGRDRLSPARIASRADDEGACPPGMPLRFVQTPTIRGRARRSDPCTSRRSGCSPPRSGSGGSRRCRSCRHPCGSPRSGRPVSGPAQVLADQPPHVAQAVAGGDTARRPARRRAGRSPRRCVPGVARSVEPESASAAGR